MSATCEERRDAAERFRFFAGDGTEFDGPVVAEALGCGYMQDRACWERLADLVEPLGSDAPVRLAAMEAYEWAEENGGLDAVRKRLMPEGLEWPRFSDGEPVRVGDEAQGESGGSFAVGTVAFLADGARWMAERGGTTIYGPAAMLAPGERAKRPAPPDSWERVMGDAVRVDEGLRGFGGSVSTCADLVRRCRALAGRGSDEG